MPQSRQLLNMFFLFAALGLLAPQVIQAAVFAEQSVLVLSGHWLEESIALEYLLDKSQKIAQTDPIVEANRFLQQGFQRYQLSQFRDAITFWEQALPLFEAIEDRRGQARTLGNLGNVYNNLSDYHQAIIYYEQALLLFEAIEDRQGQARTLNNLGSVYDNLSDYRQAIIYYEQALLLFEAIEDRQG
ncbi:tetratricopeptide repeat protein [Leptolyngbya sp. PCC 7375]|nr:tetratricopeptide repeat protein [Leptolyngbya sp. PCC 7375]